MVERRHNAGCDGGGAGRVARVFAGGGGVSADPLARRPTDTPKSWQALCDYAAMGPERSLEKYRQITGKSPAFLRQLERWSVAHDWQDRVATYDETLALEERAAREAALAERRAAWIARHMGEEEVLALLADQARGSMADFLRIERVQFHPRYAIPAPTEEDPEAVRWVTDPIPQERLVVELDMEQARDRGVLHLVKKYTDDSDGLKLELYNAQAAQKLIGQHHRLFVERQEISGPDGAPIEVDNARLRLLDLLARRAADADEAGDQEPPLGSG